jgi:hypothetical protein
MMQIVPPTDPIIVNITEAPENPVQRLADVFMGALGLTGVIAVGAIVVGLLVAGLLLWRRSDDPLGHS